MRAFIFLFIGIVALIPNLGAALQTVRLTPALLTQWTVTGMSLDALIASSQITLPSTAQLAHTYKSPTLAVSFTTQPVLGEDSATWPVFEMGSAALVFSRANSEAHLILAIDDADAVDLPGAFALDADGRAVEPLVITWSKTGANLSIEVSGKTFEFTVKDEPDLPLVFSAGNAAAWTITNLAVTADAGVFPSSSSGEGVSGVSKNSANAPAQIAGQKSAMAGSGIETATDIVGANSSDKLKALAAANTLEVFTPPSVRRGRAGDVRAAAKRIQRN